MDKPLLIMERKTVLSKVKELNDLEHSIPKKRGEIISRVIEVEEAINEIIAFHFCPYSHYDKTEKAYKKHQQLVYLILQSDFSLRNKSNTLLFILKSSYPKLLEKLNKNLMANCGGIKLESALDKMRGLRNKLAHKNLSVNSLDFTKNKEEAFYYFNLEVDKNGVVDIVPVLFDKKLMELNIKILSTLWIELITIYYKISSPIYKKRGKRA
jgi:hypothetical protein